MIFRVEIEILEGGKVRLQHTGKATADHGSASQGLGVESGEEKSVSPAVRPRGRPLDSEKHLTAKATQPWLRFGYSERTYYRRKAEGKL